MGLIIGSKLRDDYALQCNGVDQMAGVDSPPWKGDTQGAWVFDATLLSDPGGTGNFAATLINMGIFTVTGWFQISFRRNTGYGNTGIYLTVIHNPTGAVGGNASAGAITTPITVGTRVRCVVNSDRSIWINEAAQTKAAYTGIAWTSGWNAALSGSASAYTQGFGGNKQPGQPVASSGHVKLDNIMYIDRPLTSDEIAEDHNGGIRLAYQKMSFLGAIKHAWDMENNYLDRIGSAHLTPYNGPTFATP